MHHQHEGAGPSSLPGHRSSPALPQNSPKSRASAVTRHRVPMGPESWPRPTHLPMDVGDEGDRPPLASHSQLLLSHQGRVSWAQIPQNYP